MDEHQTLGYLRGKVETLEGQMTVAVKDITEIKAILNQTKGGWKALVILAGFSSAVSAAIASTWHWMIGK
jgi:hypothetical protein